MSTVTYDRSAAVNLARNVLKFKADKTITAKGVRILCEAVIGMDAALAAATDHPATAGEAEDAALTDEQMQSLEHVEYFLKAWEWGGVGQTVAQVSDSPDSYVVLTISDLRTALAIARAQGEQA